MEDPRGRPRNKLFDTIAKSVAEWHQVNICNPVGNSDCVTIGPVDDPAKAANAFRNSTAYKELREFYGDLFSIFTSSKNSTFKVGYSKEV